MGSVCGCRVADPPARLTGTSRPARVMPRPGRFGRQLRSLLWKASVADEVDAELAFHVEMRTREYIVRGLDPELARARAIGRFGDLKRINDTCRRMGGEGDMRRAEWIHEFMQDARSCAGAARPDAGVHRRLGADLAVGIGATTRRSSASSTRSCCGRCRSRTRSPRSRLLQPPRHRWRHERREFRRVARGALAHSRSSCRRSTATSRCSPAIARPNR
jgi:hypothetical protein